MVLSADFELNLVASNHVAKNPDEGLIEIYIIVTEIQRKDEFTVPGESEKASSNVWQSH